MNFYAFSKRGLGHVFIIALFSLLSFCIVPADVVEAAKVNITGTSTKMIEGGPDRIFEIRLDSPILAASGTAYVTLNLSTDDDRLELSTSSINFAASEWSEVRELVVSTTDDDDENATSTAHITLLIDANSEYYNNFRSTTTVTIVDNDTAPDMNDIVTVTTGSVASITQTSAIFNATVDLDFLFEIFELDEVEQEDFFESLLSEEGGQAFLGFIFIEDELVGMEGIPVPATAIDYPSYSATIPADSLECDTHYEYAAVFGVYELGITLGNVASFDTDECGEDEPEDSEIDPLIEFISPTPEDESTQTEDSIRVQLETSDENSGHYAITNFDDSLIGWWRFEDNSEDDSGVSAGSVWSTDGEGAGEEYGLGAYGKAGVFDGHSSFDVTYDDAIDSSFTIAAWVNLNELTEGAAIISDETGHLLQIGGENVWQFDNIFYGEYVATTSQWVHLVGSYDKTYDIETLYIDGVEIGSGGGTRTLGSTLHIGKRADGNYIDGKIDDVLIFNRVLGADEVVSLHDATVGQYQHTFGDLDQKNYSFTGYVVDSAGRKESTEERTITVTDAPSHSRRKSGVIGVQGPVPVQPQPVVVTVPVVVPVSVSAIKTISRDLEFGMVGDDISVLQEFLVSQSKGPVAAALKAGGTTNYFGPLTRAALSEWQLFNGITPAVGYFGPITRAVIAGMTF
jgi:peptidoglycan hydrolase-like protein with peptidoglycan-binding domain